jgi:hypothetical protein
MGLLVCIVALLADGHAFKSDKSVYDSKMLGIGDLQLIYVRMLGCAMSLAYCDCSAKDRGSCALF